MNTPEAAAHRHILLADHLWFSDIAKIIATKFAAKGFNIPTSELPNFMLKAYSWLDRTVRIIIPLLGIRLLLDNSRMVEVLGIHPRPVEDTILEMCDTLIEFDIVKKPRGYKP